MQFLILEPSLNMVGTFISRKESPASEMTGRFISFYDLAAVRQDLLLFLLRGFPNRALFRLERENATISEGKAKFTFFFGVESL